MRVTDYLFEESAEVSISSISVDSRKTSDSCSPSKTSTAKEDKRNAPQKSHKITHKKEQIKLRVHILDT